VRVGFIRDEQVALAEGLKPGERVVTEGALYLVDGERIRVVDGATGAATAASKAR
jgi:multidrug efflux pump subunit AcrA (membrane-fusion protein)